LLVILGVLALAAVVVPPWVNVNRFRARIVRSMEQALGREVTLGSVSLRLLPRPGFALHNLVIADDPAFGAEPMLRADAVEASLRLSALLRGRLEVARLSLESRAGINSPSLNLVRATDGRWNLAVLLQRASPPAGLAAAPSKAGTHVRFPYIEADGGRINFKIGQEKTVHVLTDADFAFWQESENEWAFRLAARPMRTDFNLYDTGTLKMNGRFRRASRLRDTPLVLDAALEDAQLGALTTLIGGHDRGWRGAFAANVHLAGTPSALALSMQAAVRDFRRYDIYAINPWLLQAQCTAKFSAPTEVLSQIDCRLPLGTGWLRVRGDLQGVVQPAAYHLTVTANQVGIQSLVTLAQRAKKDLPGDLSARGSLDGTFEVHKEPGASSGTWTGGGSTSEVALASSVLSPELKLAPLEFAFEERAIATRSFAPLAPGGAPQQPPARQRNSEAEGRAPYLVFTPFHAPLGAASPAEVSVWFGRHGYQARLEGDTWIPRLFQAGRALGLRTPAYEVDGTAHVNLLIAGNWAKFSPPQITGSALLHNITAPVAGLNAPLQMPNALVQLDPESAVLQHVAVRFAGSPVQLTVSVHLPRNCASAEDCLLTFEGQADQLSTDELNRLLNPDLAKRPWYSVFSPAAQSSVLRRVRAAGRLSANRLLIKSLIAQHLSAGIQMQSGVLTITELRADVWNGKHQGEWRVNFNAARPDYAGSGAFTGVSVPQIAALMHDNWAAGVLDARYRATMSGTSSGQFLSSLEGAADFTWRNGILRYLTLDSHAGPLQFKAFAGRLELNHGALTLAPSRMMTSSGAYEAGGTATLERQLSLRLRNGVHAYQVTGTLDKPIITPASMAAAPSSSAPQAGPMTNRKSSN
jgi:AsmA protein